MTVAAPGATTDARRTDPWLTQNELRDVDVNRTARFPGDYSMICFGPSSSSPAWRDRSTATPPDLRKLIQDALKISGFSREETLASKIR